MNKLIELLNEYWEYDLVEHNWEICKWDTNDEWEINIYTDYTNNIISKKFWFIKWLVDNDKIDLNKREDIIKYLETEFIPFFEDDDIRDFDNKECIIEKEYYSCYESLLMTLSIQDNPIEFLVNILK